MSVEQHYSPGTRETFTVFNDDDPPLMDQIAWIVAHPDSVLLKLDPRVEAVASREECMRLIRSRQI